MQVTISTLLQSKKFLAAAIATVVSFFAIREGMTNEQIAFIIGPLLVFIGAQGVADFGKESSIIDAKAYADAPETNIVNVSTSDADILAAMKRNAPRVKEILS